MPKRPSHATVVAYLALFIAVGGTSYAAATIGSAQIKDHSVRGKDIRTGTIGGREVKESSLEGVAGLDTYEVSTTATLNSPLQDVADAQVSCKRRDRVVGGGIQLSPEVPGAAVLRSGPLDLRRWSGVARIPITDPNLGRSIQVYAICLKRPR